MGDDLTIWVRVEDGPEEAKTVFRGGRGVTVPGGETRSALATVPLDRLKANLAGVCRDLAQVLEEIREVGRFRLREVTVQVEVSAEGGIQLIGTTKIAGSGGITLTFGE